MPEAEKKYEIVIDEIQDVLMCNNSEIELIASVDNPSEFKNFDITSSKQAFSQAYFGFNSRDSRVFGSHTIGSFINDNTTYRHIGYEIAANNLKRESYANSYQYYINSEKWLEEKLEYLDSLESSDLSDESVKQYEDALLSLPDIIICPEDVKFNENVTNLLLKHNIRVQRISTKCGETVLGLGDIVKLSSNSTSQNINVDNQIFKDAMKQLEFDTVSSKVSKYRKIYAKKLELIQQKLDAEYGVTELEQQGKLFTYERNYGIHQVDMNPDEIGKYSNLYNMNGQKVNVSDSDLKILDSKIDGLMKYVVELYKEKDDATYKHIIGMLSLVPVINDGLKDDEKLSAKEIKYLERMIILHDVGKLVIPTPILDKPDRLTDDELEVMHSHVNLENICLIQNDYIHSTLEQALLHHPGYVDQRLKDIKQNRLSQILPILDVYDALTGDRPYKKPHTPTDAIGIMEKVVSKGELSQHYYDALYFGLIANNTLVQEQQQEEISKGNTRVA